MEATVGWLLDSAMTPYFGIAAVVVAVYLVIVTMPHDRE
jgi:hypothetical protein